MVLYAILMKEDEERENNKNVQYFSSFCMNGKLKFFVFLTGGNFTSANIELQFFFLNISLNYYAWSNNMLCDQFPLTIFEIKLQSLEYLYLLLHKRSIVEISFRSTAQVFLL